MTQIVTLAGTLDAALLRRLLRYDPETGKLFWRVRSVDLFVAATERKANGVCAVWNKRYAGTEALTAITHGYQHGNIFDRRVRAHRAIFCMLHGYWPDQVDHINGDRMDNRPHNLREVSVAENNRNIGASHKNTSGVPGVCWDRSRSKWLVRCSKKQVGRFGNFADAVAARTNALRDQGYHQNHGRAAQCK